MDTVRDKSNHTEWHHCALAEGQGVEEDLGVRGHLDEVVELQGGERGGHARQLEARRVAVLALAALQKHLRVDGQAEAEQSAQVAHQAGEGRGVQVDPVWVDAPLLGLGDGPEQVDVDHLEEEVEAEGEGEKEEAGLEVDLKTGRVDGGDTLECFSHQHT